MNTHADNFADKIRAGLAFGVVSLFGGTLFAVLFSEGQKGEGPVANLLLGGLAAALTVVLQFYFGSSQRDSNRGPSGEPGDPVNTQVTNKPDDPVPTTTEPPIDAPPDAPDNPDRP
jgi:hypothetical protein